MALGLEVAVVLRAKGGANFLMHTYGHIRHSSPSVCRVVQCIPNLRLTFCACRHGIGAKDANEATRETIERLGAYAEKKGKGDQDGYIPSHYLTSIWPPCTAIDGNKL